jgi:hypothetical protein
MKSILAMVVCTGVALTFSIACQSSSDTDGPSLGGSGSQSGGSAGAPGSGSAASSGGSSSGGAAPIEVAYVVFSSPRLGESGVYPAPISTEDSEALRISVRFSRPMRPEPVTLRSDDGQEARTEALWSNDQRELEVVARSPSLGARPLQDQTEYALDLTLLSTEDGGPLALDYNLESGELHFKTGSYDALLNHSCSHTFFGPFGTVVAPEDPSKVPVGSLETHVQYDVNLSALESGFGGYLRLRMAQGGNYRLYSNVPIVHSVAYPFEDNSGGAGGEFQGGMEHSVLPLEVTPAACAGITHSSDLHVEASEDVLIWAGPHLEPLYRLIVEHVPEP